MSSKMNKQQQQQKQKEDSPNEGWNVIKPTKKQQQDISKDQSEQSDQQYSDDYHSGSENDKESDNNNNNNNYEGGFISVDKKQRKQQYDNNLNNSNNSNSNNNTIDGPSNKLSVPKKNQITIPPLASTTKPIISSNINEASSSLDKFNQFRERLNEQTKRYYYFDKQFFKIYNCPQINGLDMNQLLKLKDESSAIFIELRNIILSYINNNGGIVFFGFTSIKRDDCPHMEVNGFEISSKDRRRYDMLQTAFKNIISRITPTSFKADLSIMKIRKDKNRNVSSHNNKYIARIVIQQGTELPVQYVYKESINAQEISAKYSKKDQSFVVIKGQGGILQAQDQKKILVKVSELTVTPIDDFLDPNSSYKYSKNKYQGKNMRDASFLDDENEDDTSSCFTNNEDSNSQSVKSKELYWQDEHDEDKDKDVVGKFNEILSTSPFSQILNANVNEKNYGRIEQNNNLLSNQDNKSDNYLDRNNSNIIEGNNKNILVQNERQFVSSENDLGRDETNLNSKQQLTNTRQLAISSEILSQQGHNRIGRSSLHQSILGIVNSNQGYDSSAAQKADEQFGSQQSSLSILSQQLNPSSSADSFWQSKLHCWQGSSNQNAFLLSKIRSQTDQQLYSQQQLLFHNDLLANHSNINSSYHQQNNNNNLTSFQSNLLQVSSGYLQQPQDHLSTNGHVISQTSIESKIAKSLPYLSDVQLSQMINIVENQLQTYNDYLMLSISEEQRRKKQNNNSSSSNNNNNPSSQKK